MAFRGLVFTGARARLSLDNVKAALCLNASYSEEIPHDPIEPLDQYEVAEHVPIGYRVTFGCQLVRIVTNTIKNRDGVVVFPRLENILTRGEMVATVEDSPTANVVANIEGVKATRYSNNIGARGIVMKDVEFVAIRIRNESEIV